MKEGVNCGLGSEKPLAKPDLGSSHRCVGIRSVLQYVTSAGVKARADFNSKFRRTYFYAFTSCRAR